jgi:hypothetical protein
MLVEDGNGWTLVGGNHGTSVCNGHVVGLVLIQTLETNPVHR